MSIKNELKHSVRVILKRNNEGSFSTQATRRHTLIRFANDLVTLGYGLREIRNLKGKHIKAVVQHWQQKDLSISTIKNRMAHLRYLCEKINKANIIPKNDDLNIGKRKYTSQTNRALLNPDFTGIGNKYIQISLELQRLFGLRREESLKIKPHLADKGNILELLPSWCKGGRGRFVPIRTEEQRYWLAQAKEIAGSFGNSLIPQDKSYVQHLYVYEKQINRAGIRNSHGLRHAYAQQRYKELTGWESPISGGPKSKELTPEQKQIDKKARLILTEELGHSREQITVNYLGR